MVNGNWQGNWQSDLEADFLQGGLVRPTFPPGGHLLEHHLPTSLVFPPLFFLARLLLQQEKILQNNEKVLVQPDPPGSS